MTSTRTATALPAAEPERLAALGGRRRGCCRPPDRSIVLEVGCGQGGFGARLAQRYAYVGVEPDAISCAVAEQRLAAAGGRGEVRNGDLSVVGADEMFDLVCAFEVIEHIEDDADALRSGRTRLRPGGSAAALDAGLAEPVRRRPTRWSGTSGATTRRCCASC